VTFKDSNSSIIIALKVAIIDKLQFKNNYTSTKTFVRFYQHCGHIHSILDIFDGVSILIITLIMLQNIALA